MKISILVENLNKALSQVGRVVANRGQLPVLANVLIRAKKDGVEMVATDLEISIRVRVGAKVEEEGEVSVPAKAMSEFMGTISKGVVALSGDSSGMEMVGERVKAKWAGMDPSEFPAVPGFKGEASWVVDWGKVSAALVGVMVASSKEDTRPVLGGVQWELRESKGKKIVRLVATDGYRLAVEEVEVEKSGEEEMTVVVPARALAELLRSGSEETKKLEIKWEKEKQQVVFRLGEVEIVSRLLAGELPKYEQIIPREYSFSGEMNREELLEAVKRVAVFAREKANVVKLEMGGGKAKIVARSESLGGGESELEVENEEGEKLETAFNSRYLSEYLGTISEERVIFESGGSLKSGVFKLAKRGLIYLVMPVRLQE